LKKNQRDAQFIFSIFRQTPLYVSGVSTAHHQEVHRMNTIIVTYSYFCMTVCCSHLFLYRWLQQTVIYKEQ